MPLIRRLRGERPKSASKTAGALPRTVPLKCGHKQRYQVRPKNGDIVWCRGCGRYVEAGEP